MRKVIITALIITTLGLANASSESELNESRKLSDSEKKLVLFHFFLEDLQDITNLNDHHVDLVMKGILRGLKNTSYDWLVSAYTSTFTLRLINLEAATDPENDSKDTSEMTTAHSAFKDILPKNEKEIYCYNLGVFSAKIFGNFKLINELPFLSDRQRKLALRGYTDFLLDNTVLFDLGEVSSFINSFKKEIYSNLPEFSIKETNFTEFEDQLFSVSNIEFDDFLAENLGLRVGLDLNSIVKKYKFSDNEIMHSLLGAKEYLTKGKSTLHYTIYLQLRDIFLKERKNSILLKNKSAGDEAISLALNSDNTLQKGPNGLVYKILEQGSGQKINQFDEYSYKLTVTSLDGELIYSSGFGKYETSPYFDAIKHVLKMISLNGIIKFYAHSQILYRNNTPSFLEREFEREIEFGQAVICELELTRIN